MLRTVKRIVKRIFLLLAVSGPTGACGVYTPAPVYDNYGYYPYGYYRTPSYVYTEPVFDWSWRHHHW